MSTVDQARSVSAEAVIKKYYRSLDMFELKELLDCFSDNVVFCHPSVPLFAADLPDRPVRIVGKELLRKFFEFRGKEATDHRVLAFGTGEATAETGDDARRGPVYFAAGTGEKFGIFLSFGAVFELDDDGRISRYSPHIGPGYYSLQADPDPAFCIQLAVSPPSKDD